MPATTTAPAQPASEALQARKQSNLAFSFLSLDPERKAAMGAFYDFCRIVDDVADEPGPTDAEREAELQGWRDDLASCYRGGEPGRAAALAPVIQRFGMEQEHLLAIIDGCAMDIGFRTFNSFRDLQKYCYGVASAVGLCSVRIFGCTHPRIDAYAEALGYALQFTNILRDVVEDYHEMGRVYLPQDELAAFGVSNEDLADPADNPACQRLFHLQYFRAKHFFNQARRLLPESDRQNLKAALIMATFYEDILEKIAAGGFRLSTQRVRLSKSRKFRLLWRTLRGMKKPLAPKHLPGTVAIWGGGVAGLSAAIDLAREGFTPTLYEARANPGGRAHSLRDAATGLTLDNGQHIVMGCYKEFLSFTSNLGIEHKLETQDGLTVPYISPGGRRSVLQAADLPAPLHLLAGLMRFGELSSRDRFDIMRFGTLLRVGGKPRSDETAEAWLRRHGQGDGARRALWEPFCIAALNEPLATASAQLLYETLKRSLFGSADDAKIILSKVGLTELFLPEADIYLKAIGGGLLSNAQVTGLEIEGDKLKGFTTKSGPVEADLYVSAMPWRALAKLLPEDAPLGQKISQIPSAPILSIHLLCSAKLFENTEADFVGLLDSPVHWVFDRTEVLPHKYEGLNLYAVIVSAAGDWMELKSPEIVDKLHAELKRFFPAAEGMSIVRNLVYKSLDATFAAYPATEAFRPAADETPWENLLLCGDWTATGLPATLEGAALSGHRIVSVLDQRA